MKSLGDRHFLVVLKHVNSCSLNLLFTLLRVYIMEFIGLGTLLFRFPLQPMRNTLVIVVPKRGTYLNLSDHLSHLSTFFIATGIYAGGT